MEEKPCVSNQSSFASVYKDVNRLEYGKSFNLELTNYANIITSSKYYRLVGEHF